MNAQTRKDAIRVLGALLIMLGGANTIYLSIKLNFNNLAGIIINSLATILFIVGGIQLIRLKESGRKIVESLCWFYIVTGLLGAAYTIFLVVVNISYLLVVFIYLSFVAAAGFMLRFINHNNSRAIFNPTASAISNNPDPSKTGLE